MASIVRRVSAVVLLATGAACGGGGSGDSGLGDFHAVAYQAEAVGPTRTSFWGSAEAGGDLALTVSSNTDTSISGPATEEFGYSVSEGGDFVMTDPGTGEDFHAGCVAEDGGAVASASVHDGDAPTVLLMTRKTSGAAIANLAGPYRFAIFSFDGSGRSTSGVGSFDGLGSAALNAGAIVNIDGVLDLSGLGNAASYTVAPDGRVSLTVSFGGLLFVGGMDPSAELVVLGGSATPGTLAGLLVFVKGATSASPATFQGDYCMVGLAFDPGTPAMRSFAGNLTADGAGNATFQGTTNTEGTIAPTLATAATYTVAADGTLTVVTPDGAFVGGISPSGDFAVLGGPNTDGADPAQYVLIRR